MVYFTCILYWHLLLHCGHHCENLTYLHLEAEELIHSSFTENIVLVFPYLKVFRTVQKKYKIWNFAKISFYELITITEMYCKMDLNSYFVWGFYFFNLINFNLNQNILPWNMLACHLSNWWKSRFFSTVCKSKNYSGCATCQTPFSCEFRCGHANLIFKLIHPFIISE